MTRLRLERDSFVREYVADWKFHTMTMWLTWVREMAQRFEREYQEHDRISTV